VVSGERILLQHPLDQDAKPIDALPEIGVTRRQVDFDTRRVEHHGPPPSSADTTRRIVSASIAIEAHAAARQSKKSKVGRVEYHAALPYTEIGIFIGELRQQEGIASRALEFAILAAARTGEMIGAKWDEINFAECLWIVADNRMKAGKEHRVPLTDAALAILEEMQNFRSGDFVFPGGKPPATQQHGVSMLLRDGAR
jgi:integrase